MTTQTGVYALATSDHVYLEFDLARPESAPDALRTAVALVRELGTVGGVNVVVGVRPTLWARVAPEADVPTGVADFTEAIVGPDGFTMPATQHDLWLWIAAGNRTVAFDTGRHTLNALAPYADLRDETTGWVYRHDRDLTGFIDGTENPSPLEAPDVVATPVGRPGAGSTVVLHQIWTHDGGRWEHEPVSVQEGVIGRTKADSVELDDAVKPTSSHVARTVVEVDGVEQHIFRRNVAFGGITDHGTVFVGFAYDQWRLAEMLRRMAGLGPGDDGVRDDLTRYTTPRSGAYYVVPSVEALSRIAPPTDEDD